MDIFDMTQDRMEAEDRLRRMQREAAGPLFEVDRSRGTCHNCDEPVTAGTPFCNSECRDDYQRRINRGK